MRVTENFFIEMENSSECSTVRARYSYVNLGTLEESQSLLLLVSRSQLPSTPSYATTAAQFQS